MDKKQEQEKLREEYDFTYLGNGPSASGSTSGGWTMSPTIYYRCIVCGYMMSGDTKEIENCFCNTLYKDTDAGRLGSNLGDSQIEVYSAKLKKEP